MTAENKWCEYCQKASHNDAECWSTRAMNHKPAPNLLSSPSFSITTAKARAMVDLMARFAQGKK